MADPIKNCPFKKSVCKYEGVSECGTNTCPYKTVLHDHKARKSEMRSIWNGKLQLI